MLKLHCLKLKIHEEMKKSVREQVEHFSSHAPRQPARPKMKQNTLDSRANLQVHGFKRLSDIKYWWRDARGGRPWAEHCGELLKGKPLSATSLQVQVSLCTEPGGEKWAALPNSALQSVIIPRDSTRSYHLLPWARISGEFTPGRLCSWRICSVRRGLMDLDGFTVSRCFTCQY